MNNVIKVLVLAAATTAAVLISGCTQMPTEKQGIPDMRPQISFKAVSERVKPANVLIDGLAMGVVGDYAENIATLRILPGTHLLTVVLGNQIILEEKFYAGDGVSRTFTLN
ncbi:MAG: hypothetical protein V4634_20610 [Pseudomonadota bacterium]